MGDLDYPRCEIFNRWHLFDAHFEDGAGSMSLLLFPIKEANTSVMTICNQCPFWLPRMQDLQLLTLRWHSFPGWGRECLSTYFDHKGGKYIPKEHWHTSVNNLRLTVEYLNATINRTSRNAKPDIGPDASNQTRRNPCVVGYGAGFGQPRSCRSSFWTVLEPNRTVFPVQTRTACGLPWPIANSIENQQEVTCCMDILDSAITSTISASVASSNVVEACSVHCWGFLSLNSSTEIPELTASWCSISHAMRTNALVNHGAFTLRVAIHWSHSALHTPAVCYIISWQPCTSIQLHLHLIACCIWFFPFPVLRTIFNLVSSVIFSVAAFGESRWTMWCLHCSRVWGCGVLDEAPVILLDFVPLSPCCGVCGAMICCCGSEEMMIMKWSGNSWGWR